MQVEKCVANCQNSSDEVSTLDGTSKIILLFSIRAWEKKRGICWIFTGQNQKHLKIIAERSHFCGTDRHPEIRTNLVCHHFDIKRNSNFKVSLDTEVSSTTAPWSSSKKQLVHPAHEPGLVVPSLTMFPIGIAHVVRCPIRLIMRMSSGPIHCNKFAPVYLQMPKIFSQYRSFLLLYSKPQSFEMLVSWKSEEK